MARHRKRIEWKYGDLFAVPLADGSFGIIQAVDHWMPHWIYTAVTTQRIETLVPTITFDHAPNVISLLAVSDNEFESGIFQKIGHAKPLVRRRDFANERFADKGYIGATSYSGGILADFLSAWHGLAPWSPYKDAQYFDRLLVRGVERPQTSRK